MGFQGKPKISETLLLSEFHPTKNSPKTADDFTTGSSKKVWWQCLKHEHHVWEAPPKARFSQNQGCPFCSGKRPSAENNLSLHEVSSEFHPTKNGNKTPEDFTLRSGKKIWWQCSKHPEHEWQDSIVHRVHDSIGCPFCAGRRPSSTNNLSLHPVSKEFHYEKNYPLTPEDFSLKSAKKIWWKCSKHPEHEWQALISNRTNGSGCPFCSKHKPSPTNNLAAVDVDYEFMEGKNLPLTKETLSPQSGKKVWWRCNEGHEWEARVSDITLKKSHCPTCSNNGSSMAEREILEYIESLNLNPLHRERIDKVEADIYIPSKKVAIEHNGLYHHSSLLKDKSYHYTKYKHFADRGIQLIQIWEDEWRDKKDIVKKLLQAKLGLSSDRVFARKCVVVKQKCPEFFNQNHIQGAASNTKTYCLTEGNEVVAAMSFKIRGDNVWELVRYVTSKSVVGGASKLLKAFERDYPDVEIVSFADLCISNGDMYYKLGFKEDKILKPDYKYFFSGKNTRIHKFNYRIGRFKSDASLLFQEGKSESELAKMNNLLKVYDAGKIRFLK